jgi:hypothetical protein
MEFPSAEKTGKSSAVYLGQQACIFQMDQVAADCIGRNF